MIMCRSIEKNGKINTNCKSNYKKSSIHCIKSMPLYASLHPQMNSSIYESGKKIVESQLERIKKCYEGKLKGDVCKDSVDLILFKDEKCSACHQYIPELKKRVKLMKNKNIPTTLKIYDIRKNNITHLMQKINCQGLPCVAMRDIKNPLSLKKITEGIDKRISFFSKIMGEPNPLFNKVNNNKSPKGLLRK